MVLNTDDEASTSTDKRYCVQDDETMSRQLFGSKNGALVVKPADPNPGPWEAKYAQVVETIEEARTNNEDWRHMSLSRQLGEWIQQTFQKARNDPEKEKCYLHDRVEKKLHKVPESAVKSSSI
eukprot:scaffold3803_cov170-Amphora_coffeaeformis.AAC.4